MEIKKVLLTYEGHINITNYTIWLLYKIKITNNKINILIISHEEENTEILRSHTIVLIEFNNNLRISNDDYFNFNDIYYEMKIINNLNYFNDCKIYFCDKQSKNTLILTYKRFYFRLKEEMLKIYICCLYYLIINNDIYDILISPKRVMELNNLNFYYREVLILTLTSDGKNIIKLNVPQFVIDKICYWIMLFFSYLN